MAIAPIDYLGALPRPDLGQSLLQGLKIGATIQDIQAQRAAREQAALEKQKAEEMKKQYSMDLQDTLANPSQANWGKLIAKYPGQREAFGDAAKLYGQDRVNTEFAAGAQISTALENGAVDVARGQLNTIIEARKNSGQDPGIYQQIADQLDAGNIKGAQGMANMALSLTDPDKFTKIAQENRAAELQSGKVTEQQAMAQKAAIDAKFAESQQVADLEKKGWDVAKLANDIDVAKDNQKIAAMNAQLAREQNQLKREELQQKIDDKKLARDEKLRAQTVELDAARTGIDNSLSTIDRLLANPELDNILGSVEGSKFYPSTLIGLVSPIGDSDKRADALADLETIQSQAFINNLNDAKAKGASFGSLTEKEGERLIGYVTSLKAKQSETQFKNNMKEIQRLLLKSRTNLQTKYGIPKNPVSEETTTETLMQSGEIPETPNVQVSDQELTDILAKYK